MYSATDTSRLIVQLWQIDRVSTHRRRRARSCRSRARSPAASYIIYSSGIYRGIYQRHATMRIATYILPQCGVSACEHACTHQPHIYIMRISRGFDSTGRARRPGTCAGQCDRGLDSTMTSSVKRPVRRYTAARTAGAAPSQPSSPHTNTASAYYAHCDSEHASHASTSDSINTDDQPWFRSIQRGAPDSIQACAVRCSRTRLN